MSYITLEEYKQFCWLDLEDTSQDFILGKFLKASISQVKCAIWENPCKKDDEENFIEKIFKTSDWIYDCNKCYYEIYLPIPVCEVLKINCRNDQEYCYSFDGRCIKIKAQEWCLEDEFGDVCIHYYWWRDDLDDLCLLVKYMMDSKNPTKAWGQIQSVSMWCEKISLCCPDTNLFDDLISWIQTKYFSSNNITCVW